MVAVEVVTAAGEVLLCDKDQNSDLLWAAKGAASFPFLDMGASFDSSANFTRAQVSPP